MKPNAAMPRKAYTAELRRNPHALAVQTADAVAQAPQPGSSQDIQAVLGALSRLEEKVASLADNLPTGAIETVSLSPDEYEELKEQVERSRQELAELRNATFSGSGIGLATEELSAVIEATEQATETILAACEEIDTLASRIGDITAEGRPEEDALKIRDCIIQIYQAATFQDITGQRINKVRKTFDMIDDRLMALAASLGLSEEALENGTAGEAAAMPAKAAQVETIPAEIDESALLNGPQLGDQGISQDEIDQMFS